MKFTCVIDTSSYVNLSKIELGFGTLLSLFAKEVTLRFSSEVNQEIARHWNPNMHTSSQRSNKVHFPIGLGQKEYERRLFDETSRRNRGERLNFAVAIDLFLAKNKRNLVFLIDDENALRGSLNEVKDAFPIMRIWNSLDVVLYLFLTKGKTILPIDIATDALRTLNAEMATDDEKMDPIKTQKRIEKFRRYYKYLGRIQKLH